MQLVRGGATAQSAAAAADAKRITETVRRSEPDFNVSSVFIASICSLEFSSCVLRQTANVTDSAADCHLFLSATKWRTLLTISRRELCRLARIRIITDPNLNFPNLNFQLTKLSPSSLSEKTRQPQRHPKEGAGKFKGLGAALVGRSGTCQARDVAMWTIWENGTKSLREIGELFGGLELGRLG
jgi:hypothetical protein